MTASVSLEKVTCTFAARSGDGHYTAVKDVDLAIADGEFVSVVGPTGCGKSTLLNVAAGLLKPSSGSVKIHGEPLQGINRRAGYMFQTNRNLWFLTTLGDPTGESGVGWSVDFVLQDYCSPNNCFVRINFNHFTGEFSVFQGPGARIRFRYRY